MKREPHIMIYFYRNRRNQGLQETRMGVRDGRNATSTQR